MIFCQLTLCAFFFRASTHTSTSRTFKRSDAYKTIHDRVATSPHQWLRVRCIADILFRILSRWNGSIGYRAVWRHSEYRRCSEYQRILAWGAAQRKEERWRLWRLHIDHPRWKGLSCRQESRCSEEGKSFCYNRYATIVLERISLSHLEIHTQFEVVKKMCSSNAITSQVFISNKEHTMPSSQAEWRVIHTFFAEHMPRRNLELENMADVYLVSSNPK